MHARDAGAVSDYRLARLIKYSFYKNIAFSFTFFFFQFFNGWSGQASASSMKNADIWQCLLWLSCAQQLRAFEQTWILPLAC